MPYSEPVVVTRNVAQAFKKALNYSIVITLLWTSTANEMPTPSTNAINAVMWIRVLLPEPSGSE